MYNEDHDIIDDLDQYYDREIDIPDMYQHDEDMKFLHDDRADPDEIAHELDFKW